MPRAKRAASLSVLLGLTFPLAALAQGEHAMPLPARTFRLTVGGEWSHATDRFGRPTPLAAARADGALEPLGRYFGGDSLGTTELPFLSSTEAELRSLTGLGSWNLTLGRSRLRLETSVRSTPIRLEFAPSSRLVFGVAVPIVRARSYAFLDGDSLGDSQSNVGWNPELSTPGSFDLFRQQADAALAALRQQAISGPAALRAQAQAMLDGLQPFACGLYVLGAGAASDPTSPCFNAASGPASTFLPVTASEAGDSLLARLARWQSDYAVLGALYASQGVTMPGFTSPFALAAAPLDSSDLRAYVTDPAFPIAAESLTTVVRTGFGDVELSARYQLLAGPRLRSQVGVLYRLGTGTADRASNMIDVGTGDGQPDLELSTRNDIVIGRDLWLHAGARWGVQFADELERRVSPYWQPYAPAAATTTVRRRLGNYLALDLVPNWQLDEAIGVGIGYHYFRQAATVFEYASPGDSLVLVVPASVLGEGTGVSRMRVGAGITFSTLSRHSAGRARVPFRVTWGYQRTVWGRGGLVEHASVMGLAIEVYLSPF